MQDKNNDEKWLGKRFERLEIIGFERKKEPLRGWNWIVRCDCGAKKSVCPADVKSGKTRSCGCLHDECIAKRARKFKHGVYDHRRLYGIYNGIKRRCYNKREPRYKDYGQRGIRMCEEWRNVVNGFDNFVEWSLSHGYSEELTIERKDVNGDYGPENCEWVTRRDQAKNKRDTIWVDYKGEHIRLLELCQKEGVTYDTVHDRIFKRGWTVEKAIKSPSERENSLMSKCRERGVNYATVRDRIVKLGWTEEQALSTPTMGRGANLTTYGRKLEKKICAVCGAEFSPNISKQKYCGPKCHAESKHAWFKKQQQQTSR